MEIPQKNLCGIISCHPRNLSERVKWTFKPEIITKDNNELYKCLTFLSDKKSIVLQVLHHNVALFCDVMFGKKINPLGDRGFALWIILLQVLNEPHKNSVQAMVDPFQETSI